MSFSERTKMVVGQSRFENIINKTVCIFGVGGVGGACLEGLVRFGVKNIVIFDFDKIDITNLNRQLISTQQVVGLKKIDVAVQRAKSINPEINIIGYDMFISKDNLHIIKQHSPDFVVDAIDSISSKLDLIEYCHKENIQIISSLGTGNRFGCRNFTIDNVEQTAGNGCGLSRVVRQSLKKRGVTSHKAFFYTTAPESKNVQTSNGRHAPGSCPFSPNIAGLVIAQYVVDKLSSF